VKNYVVARNYAEALIESARRADAVERFGDLLDALAGAVAATPQVKAVLMSPRVHKALKQDVLAKALKGIAPEPFVRFLAAIVQRGRQGLLTEMSEAYQVLADINFNRAHASVTTAHAMDDALAKQITERLSKLVGKTVLAHYRTDPDIVGGVVIRVGDRVLDGSIRRRIQLLRARMLNPGGAGA
jgi:F-type H+-transporting ATPase subunit delta